MFLYVVAVYFGQNTVEKEVLYSNLMILGDPLSLAPP